MLIVLSLHVDAEFHTLGGGRGAELQRQTNSLLTTFPVVRLPFCLMCGRFGQHVHGSRTDPWQGSHCGKRTQTMSIVSSHIGRRVSTDLVPADLVAVCMQCVLVHAADADHLLLLSFTGMGLIFRDAFVSGIG